MTVRGVRSTSWPSRFQDVPRWKVRPRLGERLGSLVISFCAGSIACAAPRKMSGRSGASPHQLWRTAVC